MFLSDEGLTFETLDFTICWQHTNLFIFWFVSEHCLRNTLHLLEISIYDLMFAKTVKKGL